MRTFKTATAATAAALAALTLAGCSIDTTSAKSSDGTGVSQGLGAQNATGDVTLGHLSTDEYGMSTVTVTVTNHSSKRSDYFIDVSVESPDGAIQYDSGTAMVSNVDPGQTGSDDVMFTKTLPAGAHVVLKTVQRSPSL